MKMIHEKILMQKKTAGKTLAKLEADDVGNTECTIHIRTCYYSNEISYCFLGIC